MSRRGERLPLPVAGNGRARCAQSGEHYRLADGIVSIEFAT
jgi:hypothetical protein